MTGRLLREAKSSPELEQVEEEEKGEGRGYYGYDGIGDSFGRAEGRMVVRRYVLDCGADSEKEEEEEESGELRSLDAFGRHESGEGREEGGTEVVDVASIVKLRKQVKVARRLSGQQGLGLRVRRRGEVKAVRSVPVLCVEGQEIR